MVVHQIAREKNSVTTDLSKNKNISEKKYYNYYKKENSE